MALQEVMCMRVLPGRWYLLKLTGDLFSFYTLVNRISAHTHAAVVKISFWTKSSTRDCMYFRVYKADES